MKLSKEIPETNLEHGNTNSTGLVGATESVELAGHQLGAVQGLNNDVQTGQNGVGLGQKVAIAHKFGLGNVSELAELLLVFGVGLDETVSNGLV